MKRRPSKIDRDLTALANSLTPEQAIRLYEIADPNPPTAEERARLDAMTDDELLAALLPDSK